MKKSSFIIFGSAVLALALSACGDGNNHAGTYTFILGNDSTAKIGFIAQLSNEPYDASVSDAKRFDLTLEYKDAKKPTPSTSESSSPVSSETSDPLSSEISSAETSSSETSSSISSETSSGETSGSSSESSSSQSSGEIPSSFHVEGTYVPTEESYKGKQYVSLEIKKYDEDVLPLPPEIMPLINAALPYILYCTIDYKSLSLTMPVSLNDLVAQIVWYSEHDPFKEQIPEPTEEGHWWTVTIDLFKN